MSGISITPHTKILRNWSLITLSNDDVVDIIYPFKCSANEIIWDPSSQLTLSGLMNNISYSGTYTIDYAIDATGYTFEPFSQTINGLTISTDGGIGLTSGHVKFLISGTYTGADGGSISFNVYDVCDV